MMHHSQIVQRVFNTPPMADPTKALAFLTGLGARITGRVISIDGLEVAAEEQANPTLPARASLFGDELTSHQARNGGHAHPCWRPQGRCQSLPIAEQGRTERRGLCLQGRLFGKGADRVARQ